MVIVRYMFININNCFHCQHQPYSRKWAELAKIKHVEMKRLSCLSLASSEFRSVIPVCLEGALSAIHNVDAVVDM